MHKGKTVQSPGFILMNWMFAMVDVIYALSLPVSWPLLEWVKLMLPDG